MRNRIQAALETKPYPSKKRGLAWLVASIVLFGAAFFLFTLIVISTAMRAALAIGRDVAENVVVLAGQSGFDAQVPHQLSRLELCGNLLTALAIVLGYFGIWYGVMLIVGAYKKYSFNKVRLLTLLLSISFVTIVLLTSAYSAVSDDCEVLSRMGEKCPPVPMSILNTIIEQVQAWISILVY